MRSFKYNKKAISNVLGYLMAFTITSSVMLTAVMTTTSIINDKVNEANSLQSQTLANLISNTLVDAAYVVQSMPDAEYNKILDVPPRLAGDREYYIEITPTMVYIKTTDGAVQESAPIYGAESLDLHMNQKIYTGSGKIKISYQKPSAVYTLDFSVGNSTNHSAVESGSYFVSPSNQHDPDWPLDFEESHYRIPILINNTVPPFYPETYKAKNLTNFPLKIDLNPTNFDYTHAHVDIVSSSSVDSDIVFMDENDETLQYCIDYWNPDGNSIIYVQIPYIGVNTSQYIYLYYGDEAEAGKERHSLGDVAEFFDDFDAGLDINWNKTYDGVGENDEARSVATDANGDVYVIGYGKKLNGSSTGKDWWIMKFDRNGLREWNMTFDGNDDDDVAESVTVDNDNNVYVVGGGTNLNGSGTGDDYWIMKFNSDGDRQWNKTYDNMGFLGFGEGASSVATDSNGNAYVVGSTWNPGYDWWIMKFNSDGEREWEKIFEGGGWKDKAKSVAVDASNDVYVVGCGLRMNGSETGLDWWIMKLNPDGELQWNKTYDSGGCCVSGCDDHDGDVAYSVATDSTDNVYVVGTGLNLSSGTYYDWWIMKFDRNGLREWNMTFNGNDGGDGDDFARSVATDTDDNVYVVGYGSNVDGSSTGQDWWIMKFDSNGGRKWTKTYDGNGNARAYSVTTDTDDFVYIVGYGRDMNGSSGSDWCIKKFYPDGTEITEEHVDYDPYRWIVSDSKPTFSNSCAHLTKQQYLFTREYLLDTVDNGSLYIVEANISFHSDVAAGGMILLNQNTTNYDRSYLLSANNATESANISLYKCHSYLSEFLQSTSLPTFHQYMRMKAYVYLSDNFTGFTEAGTAAYLNGFLYDSEFYTPFGNVSIVDTNFVEPELPIPNGPYLNGSIGLFAGPNNGYISVDWIRVLKTTPGFYPIVKIGAWECNNWGWDSDINSESVANDSFTPGPLFQDYNYHSGDKVFLIKNFPNDEYRLTVTIGKLNGVCGSVTVEVTGGDIGESSSMIIPETEEGVFTQQSLLFSKNGAQDFSIKFSGADWAVNSLRIEKKYQGILIEEVSI